MKQGYLGQAWLVLALSLGFGGALAGVEVALAPRIRANKLQAAVDEIATVVAGSDSAVSGRAPPMTVAVGEGPDRRQYEVFRALAADGRQVGWAIKAGGKGFADRIELLVGVDLPVKTITGLAILEEKETPGLGSRIREVGTADKRGFLWPFFHWGPAADRPLVVTRASPKMGEAGSANKIQAVGGATISSKSVCDIVNAALCRQMRDALAQAPPAGPIAPPAGPPRAAAAGDKR